MLALSLALALSPQAACDTTSHEAPAPLPPIGQRVAVDGGRMVSLGPRFQPPSVATVWSWSVDGWVFEDDFAVGVDPFFFGGALALSGDDVLIASTDHFNGAEVGVFRQVGGGWTEVQAIQPFTSYTFAAVDDCDLVARGGDAYLGNTWNGEVVHLVRQPSGTWTANVVATGPAWPAGYGHSIDFDEDWLIVGAHGAPGGGTATIYPRLAGGALGAPVTLTSSLGAAGFGVEVAIDGGVAVVRADVGPIEAFEFGGSGWSSTGEIDVPLGYSAADVHRMDLRHGLLALGMPLVPNGGRIVEIRHNWGGFWIPAMLRRPLDNTDSGLGVDLLETPYGLVAGGDGYVQRWIADQHVLSLCECGPALAPCGNAGPKGCLNASGESARLRACGSRSLAAANLALVADRLNSGTWGIVFHGSPNGSPFFSQNGTVCVGGPTWRYLPHLAHGTTLIVDDVVAFDQANHPPGGRLTAGQTYAFQLWYRDVGGPCGATSNFTNAVAVPFVP